MYVCRCLRLSIRFPETMVECLHFCNWISSGAKVLEFCRSRKMLQASASVQPGTRPLKFIPKASVIFRLLLSPALQNEEADAAARPPGQAWARARGRGRLGRLVSRILPSAKRNSAFFYRVFQNCGKLLLNAKSRERFFRMSKIRL